MTYTVGIFVFDQVEVLDFAGPYEVFTTAARVQQRFDPAPENVFTVFTVGRTGTAVRARAGLLVQPDYSFNNAPAIDVLIIPGGVVDAENSHTEVAQWIVDVYSKTVITASVCTGAFFLAKTGLLLGKSATTHWEDIADLRLVATDFTVQENIRWVDEGSIVTSAGISAGIDMSLHLVERLAGRSLAEKTARQLDFDWTENP